MDYLRACLAAKPGYDQVIDFGSGDWQFSQHIKWAPADYLGIEVVTSVFDKVQAKFQDSDGKVAFVNEDFSDPLVVRGILDAYRDTTNLLLVKDVLQHWEDHEVRDFLDAIFAMAKKDDTLLVTNHWHFIRAPRPIPDPRELDRYRWCPIDLLSPKWKEYGFYKALTFWGKMVVRRDF